MMPAGKTARGGYGKKIQELKEDMHGADVFLIDAMDHYISNAPKDSIMILISGEWKKVVMSWDGDSSKFL